MGLDLAIRHPDRVGKVLALAANTQTSGTREGVDQNPLFAKAFERAEQEYASLSATPKEFEALLGQLVKMWKSEPSWTDEQLKSIKSLVWVVSGDHDEFIKREHTEHIAAAIPGAGLLILPNVSHFAPLQNPALFNAVLLQFLDGR